MTPAVIMTGSRQGRGSVMPPSMLKGHESRSVVLVVMDDRLRASLAAELKSLRWSVREAKGGAAMFDLLEQMTPAACIVDSWLPDLDVRECLDELAGLFPGMDVLMTDGAHMGVMPARGAYRGELLHALRQVQESPELAAESPAGEPVSRGGLLGAPCELPCLPSAEAVISYTTKQPLVRGTKQAPVTPNRLSEAAQRTEESKAAPLPEFVGEDARMLEVSRRIRLVAARKTTVLVHGPTGTGKELVARAVHRLSGLPQERFVSINCAAIPEALVEAELFGYARGAFTGAVQSRIGRIEAAAGGTLFLDEIGELPLAVQGKLLRFLECGEVQRVGENEPVRVSARVVTATHRKLGAMAAEGTFRLDLLHRLSVFLIETPGLAGRGADIDRLIAHSLERLSEDGEPKQLSAPARAKLHAHNWPGNVRELEHTLERAWILVGDSLVIDEEAIDFGETLL